MGQELVLGGCCFDHDGKILWDTNNGHGDAMHLGDFVPERNGLELFVCHEESPYGISLIDARNGNTIWRKTSNEDTGRCAGGNILASNSGSEFWGAAPANTVFDANGNTVASKAVPQNFLIYWDGDPERELLDGVTISKMTSVSNISTIFTASGCASNNGTKATPCLSADIFGDWREELLVRTSDNNAVRVFATPYETDVRLTTLMHDPQYRNQVAGQNVAYNQPPHTSFYLGSDAPLPDGTNGTGNSGSSDFEPVSYKFDLGNTAQSGWISVSASEIYSEQKGYGFSSASNVSNVSAAGSGALGDAVKFTGSTTFDVKLPNGLYKVKVTLGNTDRTTIYMEDMLQIINMTGNNAEEEILVPVSDGKLNIRAAAGRAGKDYTISAVEIEKVSDEAILPKTVWLCGDSTVCNYYNTSDESQHGWGQFLGDNIGDSWNIRNMASSGQKGVNFAADGQFDVIETYGKSGDIFVISIGINDTDENEYYNKITDMVQRAKAKGMTVLLVKQQGRRSDLNRNPLLTSRWYASTLDRIGSEQNVQVVDLFDLWQNFGMSVGYDGMGDYYAIKNDNTADDLHQSKKGAQKLAELFASVVDVFNDTTLPPNDETVNENIIHDGGIYRIKNTSTGTYLTVLNNEAKNSVNVLLGNGTKWKLVEKGGGYYSLIAQVGDGNSYALDVSGKKTADGTNIEIYTAKDADNQQFKLEKNTDGSYKILTKITGDASCVALANDAAVGNADVKQYALANTSTGNWIFEPDTMTITVRKTWETVGNINVSDRPVTIILNQVNKSTTELIQRNFRTGNITEYTDNIGTIVFSDLPRTNADGTIEYAYTIEEPMPAKYAQQYVCSIVKSEEQNTIEVVNRLKTGKLYIEKEWINPNNTDLSDVSVTVNIYVNDYADIYRTVELKAPTWSVDTSIELPIYDGSRNGCSYHFEEVVNDSDVNYKLKSWQWLDDENGWNNVNDNGILMAEGVTKHLKVTNEIKASSHFLPDTGGSGTKLFTITGTSMIIISLTCLAARKRNQTIKKGQ